jgi:hypothetical protein
VRGSLQRSYKKWKSEVHVKVQERPGGMEGLGRRWRSCKIVNPKFEPLRKAEWGGTVWGTEGGGEEYVNGWALDRIFH